MSSNAQPASKAPPAFKSSTTDAEINIFDFQNEISAAEDYLRSSKGSLSATSPSDVTGAGERKTVEESAKPASSSGANVKKPHIEETRKKDILEGLGRKPLVQKQQQQQVTSATASKPSTVGGTSSATSAVSKYNSRVDKEKLINRLLEEHVSKTENREHYAATTGALVTSMNSDMNTAGGRIAASTSFGTAPDALQSPHQQDKDADVSRSSYQQSDTTEDTLYYASDIPFNTAIMPAEAATRGAFADFSNNQPFDWGVFDGTATSSSNVVFGREGDRGVFAYNTSAGGDDSMNMSKMVTINNAGKRSNAYFTDFNANKRTTALGTVLAVPKKYLKSKDDLILEARKDHNRTFTHTPKLSSKVRRSASLERRTSRQSAGASAELRQERIEKLQREHEERLRLREKQKKELENIEMLECTFKPHISKGAQVIMRSKAAAANEGDSEDNKEMLLLRSQQTLRGNDAAAILRLSSGTEGSSGAIELSKRLHEEAEQRAAQQRWIEQRVTEAKMSEYTFQPTINPHTEEIVAATEHRPIHHRIGELQKEKSRKLQELRQTVEKECNGELTFQPRIDPNSTKMANAAVNRSTSALYGVASSSLSHDENDGSTANRSSADAALLYHMHTDIGSRLINEGRMLARRKQKMMQDRERVEASLYEQVRPSKGSQNIARRNPQISSVDFIERQQKFNEKVKSESDRRQREAEEGRKALFKPDVDSKSRDIAAKARPGTATETAEERATRLSVIDAEVRELKREARETLLYGDIDFTPRIDPVSRAVGRASSWQELVENKKGKRVRESALRKVEQMRAENETYRPKINKTYRQASGELSTSAVDASAYDIDSAPFGWVDCPMDAFDANSNPVNSVAGVNRSARLNESSSNYNNASSHRRANINMKKPEIMSKNIKQYLNDKEERRRQEIVAREIEELRDCTFAPEVQPYKPHEAADPVIVRGLGRHLELKKLLEKKKSDIKEREDEVFRVQRIDKYRRPEDGSTIVKPFAFSASTKGPSKAVQDSLTKERRELKFRPEINDTRKTVKFIHDKAYRF